MTFGSLFAGIGGMDLGLERAGMECRWQCEIDPFARKVLAKHWPDVRRHDDVRTFPPKEGDWHVDLIAGGFPCQDISFAGKGAGLAGERSGLWYEFARVVRDLRPRYVLVENVAALLVRGLDAVLGTLASLGYDAEWVCLPAAAVGAPHIRDRVFIVADAEQDGWRIDQGQSDRRGVDFSANRARKEGATKTTVPFGRDEARSPRIFAWPSRKDHSYGQEGLVGIGRWPAEPQLDRVVDGVPNGMERIGALGNAVVPQVAEWIGRRIVEFDARAMS